MKIRRFFESINNELSIIKECFSNISDDMDDIINIDFVEINSNFFEVNISIRNIQTKLIESEADINKLDKWSLENIIDNKLIIEMKSAIQRLIDDDFMECFKILKTKSGYEITINTKITDIKNDSPESWLKMGVDEESIRHDKFKFKAIVKKKFNIDVENSFFDQGFDRHDDPYISFDINLSKEQNKEKIQEIIEWLKTIRIPLPTWDNEEYQIFPNGFNNSGHHTLSKSLHCEVNDLITTVDE